MPDTEIAVSRERDRVVLTINVSLSDLELAVPGGILGDNKRLTPAALETLNAYFAEHTVIEVDGTSLPVAIDDIYLVRSRDTWVGPFEELVVVESVRAVSGQPLKLHYDAVLHQIANHRAIVHEIDGTPIGIIRFDLSEKHATPLMLPGQ